MNAESLKRLEALKKDGRKIHLHTGTIHNQSDIYQILNQTLELH